MNCNENNLSIQGKINKSQPDKSLQKICLNIGGGPYFNEVGWINLEEVVSNVNPLSFKFTPDCKFPVDNLSMNLVYTSHCLEHLNQETVCRVLDEVYRVLKYDGPFIIKLPDFDRVLDHWRCKDNDAEAFFDDRLWDYKSIVHTWKNRDIINCLDYKASMIFCGFWNDAYGDHYSGKRPENEFAYHGPAVTTIEFLNELTENKTPSQISSELRKIVIETEKNYHFNHQNAWSRDELAILLKSFNFKVKTFDKELICEIFDNIPDIKQMEMQSIYCWAEKF